MGWVTHAMLLWVTQAYQDMSIIQWKREMGQVHLTECHYAKRKSVCEAIAMVDSAHYQNCTPEMYGLQDEAGHATAKPSDGKPPAQAATSMLAERVLPSGLLLPRAGMVHQPWHSRECPGWYGVYQHERSMQGNSWWRSCTCSSALALVVEER